MLDINGVKIEAGDTVKTMQPAGGVLPPANSVTGIAENCVDPFGNNAMQIRYKKDGQSFDRLILLDGKINEVINKGGKS